MSAILIILFLLFCGISNCQADEPPPRRLNNSFSTQELPTATPVLDLKKAALLPGYKGLKWGSSLSSFEKLKKYSERK